MLKSAWMFNKKVVSKYDLALVEIHACWAKYHCILLQAKEACVFFFILTPVPLNEILEWDKGVDQARACFYLLKDGWVRDEEEKETKGSHRCRSHDVLRVCPPPLSRVVKDVMGWVLLAVGLAMPLVPYDGPFQLGQGLLPGRRCLVSCAMHMLYWLCFSLCMMVMEGHSWRGEPKASLSKVANSWFLHCACKQHVFVMQLFRRALQCRFLLWGLHKVVTVLFHWLPVCCKSSLNQSQR